MRHPGVSKYSPNNCLTLGSADSKRLSRLINEPLLSAVLSRRHGKTFLQVTCLAMARDDTLLASAQTQGCCIRVWNYKTADCMSVFRVNACSLISLDFSENGSVLAGAGLDTHRKTVRLL